MRTILFFLSAWSLVAGPLAVVRTGGQYDGETVLYSAYVATAEQTIGGVAVGITVPLGSRFIESVDVPAGVQFEGVRDNVAVWTVGEIGADRVVGPFTFRVKPDGEAALPAEASAAVSFERPEKALEEYSGNGALLTRPEDSGSVIFDARGTLDGQGKNAPVLVGKTGILLFVPEGGVRTQTTITFDRQRVDPTKLPRTDEETWWCAQYQVSVSPLENSAKGISFSLPSRRALPLGLPMSIFAAGTGGSWQKYSAAETPKNFGFGSSGGGFGCSTGGFGSFGCSTGPTCLGFNCGFQQGGFGQFGFGVAASARNQPSISGAQLSTQLGTPVTAISAIVDGTSNTIAILTGKR